MYFAAYLHIPLIDIFCLSFENERKQMSIYKVLESMAIFLYQVQIFLSYLSQSYSNMVEKNEFIDAAMPHGRLMRLAQN